MILTCEDLERAGFKSAAKRGGCFLSCLLEPDPFDATHSHIIDAPKNKRGVTSKARASVCCAHHRELTRDDFAKIIRARRVAKEER